jgi:sec-independent protein translocase protein TatB
MFGISFGELLLVALIALLVLGPERLPGAARTAGLWVGRLKRSFNAIKQEVEREIGADEIRRQLHNEEIMALEQQNKSLLPSAAPASDSLPNPVPTGTPMAVGSPAASAPISHDSPPPPRAP